MVRGTAHSSPFPSQYGLEHSMHSVAQLDILEIKNFCYSVVGYQ